MSIEIPNANNLELTGCQILDLYDLDHTLAADYLRQFTYPWEALSGIKQMIITLGNCLGPDYRQIEENVWVHETARMHSHALITQEALIIPEHLLRKVPAFIDTKRVPGLCVVR